MMSLRQNEEEKKQWEEEKRMAGLKYKDEILLKVQEHKVARCKELQVV